MDPSTRRGGSGKRHDPDCEPEYPKKRHQKQSEERPERATFAHLRRHIGNVFNIVARADAQARADQGKEQGNHAGRNGRDDDNQHPS